MTTHTTDPVAATRQHVVPGRLILSVLLITALAGCSDRSVNDMRMQRYNQPDLTPVTVQPRALAVTLLVAANGRGLSKDSLAQLNKLLNQQGRLARQSLTITPYTVRGEQMANRLANALKNAGADGKKLIVQRRTFSSGQHGDLEVMSQALAVTTSRCQINDPGMLMVDPFASMGYLGCATQNNLAMMVSDPHDLIQARALDDADGVTAVNSIERYQQDEVKDLIDINFDGDSSGGGN